MKKSKKQRGFSLIELMVVVGILALLSAIVFPVYVKIQDRAKVTAAMDNANAIITCLNAHNNAAKVDPEIESITGVAVDDMVVLSGVDSEGTANNNIDSVAEFNNICENKVHSLSEEDYVIALEYITFITPDDEFTLKEDYKHIG